MGGSLRQWKKVEVLDGLREIANVLRRNQLRTWLTALSVAWGMFMLALLLGAGRGLENGVAWEFRDQAVNSIWVSSGQVSLPYAGRRVGRDVRFRNGDLDAIGRGIAGIDELTAHFYLWGEFQVRVGNKHAAFDIRGVHPGYRAVERTKVTDGRYINERDVAEQRKVAVIGHAVREALFGQRAALGERIEIRGLSYLVIGEFTDEGGEGELRKIYIPVSTAQAVYGDPARIHNVAFTLKSLDVQQSRATAEATRLLVAKRHGVSPADRRAVRTSNDLEEFHRVTQVFSWISVFVWVVGLGTLLSGLVGVGNIMLIAVAERTREIGVRKSLGATPFSIVGMILIEATIITALAGYTGLVLGVGLVELVAARVPDLPFIRQPHVDLKVALGAAASLVVLEHWLGSSQHSEPLV
jgi:putative ABC transport system permease protein